MLRSITMSVFIFSLETLCYLGNFLSGIIAGKIYRMQHKTRINKMFLFYFSIDCWIGSIEPYFLFKLYKERWHHFAFNRISNNCIHFLCLVKRYAGEELQERNCLYFLSSWMLWDTQRQLFNSLMMMMR